MIVEPKIRGFVCITAHPTGCGFNMAEQIAYAKEHSLPSGSGPKRVLVVGASTGYGLSSRVAAAFSCSADTLGVYFEREAANGRTGTAGHYNSVAFCEAAQKAGLKAIDVNGDAFSNEVKDETIEKAKALGGQFDLVVYSLASPRRTDPSDGQSYRACLKPVGAVYKNQTLDTDKGEVKEISIDPASEDDVLHTRKVMGGEDWKAWTEALLAADLLAPGAINIAYSYIGPQVTWPIYRNGTIGRAKEHLEETAGELMSLMENSIGGKAYVSVNKAVVTQASSAIPVVPLYVSLLFKIMKEKGTHEGCIEQICRLFQERLYANGELECDDQGRIRLDDWEMSPEIQETIIERWPHLNTENLTELTDFEGYRKEFLKLFGFGRSDIDYSAEVEV